MLYVVLALLPLGVVAQESSSRSNAGSVSRSAGFNAPTLAVLLANRPPHIEEAQWLKMMEEPVNRGLYPIRVTQALLDTVDATQLDLRFQYVMVKEMPLTPDQNKRP